LSIKEGNNLCDSGLKKAVVLFKRPDVEPYVGDNSSVAEKYKKLQIQLITKGGKSKYVIINEVGSIEVKTESMCSSTS
jgi:nucleoside-triphosphatase THEP1